jgi:hypothetical protein
MISLRRLLPHVLFASGVVLVLTGLSAAQSTAGMVASVSAVAALLYVGAVWFGGVPSPRKAGTEILLFDGAMRIVSPSIRGRSVVSAFPDSSRSAVEQACAAALAGEFTRFAIDGVQFSVVPIRGNDGRVIYGMITAADALAMGDTVLPDSRLVH